MKGDSARLLTCPSLPQLCTSCWPWPGAHLHGYGIMQKVLRQSEGRYKLGLGTLYDNIQRLTAQGLGSGPNRYAREFTRHEPIVCRSAVGPIEF